MLYLVLRLFQSLFSSRFPQEAIGIITSLGLRIVFDPDSFSENPIIVVPFTEREPGFSAISSTIVRDILRNGGDISQFVPKEIAAMLQDLR